MHSQIFNFPAFQAAKEVFLLQFQVLVIFVVKTDFIDSASHDRPWFERVFSLLVLIKVVYVPLMVVDVGTKTVLQLAFYCLVGISAIARFDHSGLYDVSHFERSFSLPNQAVE